MMKLSETLRSLALVGILTLLGAGVAWADDDDDDGNSRSPFPRFGPSTIDVDCAAGDTISAAVDAVFPGREVRIVLVGDCTEDVTIRKDGITLDGDPNGTGVQGGTATLVGGIRFEDAHRLAVRNLTVRNPSGIGVIATEGASFKVENSIIAENSEEGVVVFDGASGSIRNSVISDNAFNGIVALDGAFVRVEYNLVQGNGNDAEFGHGILVARAIVRANGNQFVGNGYSSITVIQNGTYLTGTAEIPEIIGPGTTTGIALDIGRQGFVDLRNVEVEGRIDVFQASELDIRGTSTSPSRVSGEIRAVNLATVRLLRNVDASGAVFNCPFPSICSCNFGNICPTSIFP